MTPYCCCALVGSKDAEALQELENAAVIVKLEAEGVVIWSAVGAEHVAFVRIPTVLVASVPFR